MLKNIINISLVLLATQLSASCKKVPYYRSDVYVAHIEKDSTLSVRATIDSSGFGFSTTSNRAGFSVRQGTDYWMVLEVSDTDTIAMHLYKNDVWVADEYGTGHIWISLKDDSIIKSSDRRPGNTTGHYCNYNDTCTRWVMYPQADPLLGA